MNRELKFRLWNKKDKEWDSPAIVEVFSSDGILLAKTPICTVSKVDGDYVYVEETKRFGEIGNVGYHYTRFELKDI